MLLANLGAGFKMVPFLRVNQPKINISYFNRIYWTLLPAQIEFSDDPLHFNRVIRP